MNATYRKSRRLEMASTFDRSLASLFDEKCKNNSPHLLMELSVVEWRRMRENSILLSQKFKKNTNEYSHVYFTEIQYGSNIIKRKKKSRGSCGGNMGWINIDVINMKKKYFAIVCHKNDVMDENNIIINGRMRNQNDKWLKEDCGSGMLLLCFCAVNHEESNSLNKWGMEECKILTACKKNIITKKNNHNMSLGEYFSFGNKGSFDNEINNSSVGQYKNKKYKNDSRQHVTDWISKKMHEQISHQLEKAIATMLNILPTLRQHISPIVDTASKIQQEDGDVNLKKCPGYQSGCWQSQVCINACTRRFHTENDCTYTIITVPNQVNTSKSSDSIPQFDFLYMIKPKCYVGIDMKIGTTFLFSGYMLTHRQHCYPPPESNDYFFNLASYGNKRLFNHLKTSLLRIMDNNK